MAFPTTGLLDDFTGAAGADPNFTIIDGGTGFAGVNYDGAGNGITAVSTKFAWAYWNPNTAFGPDTECYFTISAIGTAANAIRALARITGQGTANWTGYFVAAQLFTSVAWTIQRHDVGSNVTLATGPVQALAVGDQMGIEIVGTVINAKYKPAAGAWTTLFSYDTAGDATKYSTAGAIGAEFGLKTSKLNDFDGGTVVGGTTPVSNAVALPLESLAAISAAGVSPLEALAGIEADLSAPLEALAGIAAPDPLPLEALAAVAGPAPLPLESVLALVASGLLPLESVRGITQQLPFPLESLAAVLAAAGLPIEALGIIPGHGHEVPTSTPLARSAIGAGGLARALAGINGRPLVRADAAAVKRQS